MSKKLNDEKREVLEALRVNRSLRESLESRLERQQERRNAAAYRIVQASQRLREVEVAAEGLEVEIQWEQEHGAQAVAKFREKEEELQARLRKLEGRDEKGPSEGVKEVLSKALKTGHPKAREAVEAWVMGAGKAKVMGILNRK